MDILINTVATILACGVYIYFLTFLAMDFIEWNEDDFYDSDNIKAIFATVAVILIIPFLVWVIWW